MRRHFVSYSKSSHACQIQSRSHDMGCHLLIIPGAMTGENIFTARYTHSFSLVTFCTLLGLRPIGNDTGNYLV